MVERVEHAARVAYPKTTAGRELVKALNKRKKPRRTQLPGPIAGTGQQVNGASTSTTRVGY